MLIEVRVPQLSESVGREVLRSHVGIVARVSGIVELICYETKLHEFITDDGFWIRGQDLKQGDIDTGRSRELKRSPKGLFRIIRIADDESPNDSNPEPLQLADNLHRIGHVKLLVLSHCRE